jgi:transcriptional regulator with XRE-family HTH domain
VEPIERARGGNLGTSSIGERMRTSRETRRVSRKPLRLRELREERGLSQHGLAEESGVGRSTIAALEAGQRGAHPTTVHALARALGVTVPDLYRTHTIPLPSQDRPTQTAQSYARLRQSLRDAFPGVENAVDLELMAEQFMVELGWLQERSFPLYSARPRTKLSAHDLLELADDFYRFRTKPIAWPMQEPSYVPEVSSGGEA